ncbi:translation elongation factor Ts [Limisphaera sp. VF-2]|jgi:elongation factor Ts|uniref:translation elongation factor Ts n=1 Tax=Limisphaera sp. VF-2 TaxID=3400418 RepID=UPI0017624E7B|nr:translation elongation factor Ts [Limisphaera sp.]
MAEVTAAQVVKLREMTNAGMMDCKRALVEAGGDMEKAVEILRKKGAATAAHKAAREAREGVIVAHVLPGARAGVLVEVNCETDFVARNDLFRAFAQEVAARLAADPQADLEPLRQDAVSRIRENLQIARHARLEVEGHGLIAAYIHTGAQIGVLVEVGATRPETVATEAFKQLVRDITLQIAASSPMAVSREQLPETVIAKEREIAAEQVKGKPPAVVQRIVEGKLEKFYQTVCLLEQGYVKQNSEISVREYIDRVGRELGDSITVRRFLRYQVGELAT